MIQFFGVPFGCRMSEEAFGFWECDGEKGVATKDKKVLSGQ